MTKFKIFFEENLKAYFNFFIKLCSESHVRQQASCKKLKCFMTANSFKYYFKNVGDFQDLLIDYTFLVFAFSFTSNLDKVNYSFQCEFSILIRKYVKKLNMFFFK